MDDLSRSSSNCLETPQNTKTLKIDLSSLEKLMPSPSLSDLDFEEEQQIYKIGENQNTLNILDSEWSFKNSALDTFSLISFDDQKSQDMQKIDEIQFERILNLVKDEKVRFCKKISSRKQISYLQQICLKSNEQSRKSDE